MFHRIVVALKWFEKWKKYVGFESFDRRFTGKKEYFPGSIDNSALFKSVEIILNVLYCYCVAIDTSDLKDDLKEGLDYAIISEPAWNIFFSKYGSSQPIPR